MDIPLDIFSQHIWWYYIKNLKFYTITILIDVRICRFLVNSGCMEIKIIHKNREQQNKSTHTNTRAWKHTHTHMCLHPHTCAGAHTHIFDAIYALGYPFGRKPSWKVKSLNSLSLSLWMEVWLKVQSSIICGLWDATIPKSSPCVMSIVPLGDLFLAMEQMHLEEWNPFSS